MQAHLRWLHAIRKRVITEEKCGVKKYENTQLFFASTQLRITTLRKYPFDPKAYLGRCMQSKILFLPLIDPCWLTFTMFLDSHLSSVLSHRGGQTTWVDMSRPIKLISLRNHNQFFCSFAH